MSAENTSENAEVNFQAVEKNGEIIAIWEMRGRKHVRTIDPRSQEGRRLLSSYKPAENDKSKKESA